jgi:hypothetical protein
LPKLVRLTFVGFLLATEVARAAMPASPSWLKADDASRKAEIDIIAAFNENNTSWNFNGYHTGNATVLVPPGWLVEVPFRNEEAEVPHSMVVIADPGDEAEYPSEVGEEAAALPGAHTTSPVEGTAKGAREAFSFRADTTGDYLWYCGVPGHGNAGMWIRLRVTDEVKAPAVLLAADAEPGRE